MKKSVGVKFSLQITVLIFVICLVFGIISSTISENLLKNSLEESLNTKADDCSKLVQMEVKQYINNVESIAQRPDIIGMDWDTQKRILISEAKRIGFERFQVGYPNGDVISTTGDTSNAADREFFKQAMGGTSNISDVIFARIDKKMVIVISAPIKDESGKVVGILSGVTDASKLNEIITSLDLKNGGYGFIINKDGIKMAHSEFNTSLDKINSSLDVVSKSINNILENSNNTAKKSDIIEKSIIEIETDVNDITNLTKSSKENIDELNTVADKFNI